MVECSEESLNNIFHALADPTRRAMIGQLAAGERTVAELAEPYPVSLAAASKHIKVLEKAGLLRRRVQGRTHICRLDPATLSAANAWIRFYERFWDDQLDMLERELNRLNENGSEEERE
ncbi:ArsR/SmtB family transcription factor [Paenibacillus arenilitoris]|uniref:Winged helix-turn-helix transcriptional regulator n=1 Tax=Paenibacillus arenilitoris TaxID=2772299 RepID=A0A927CNL1_9BACL|nr:metalloregulator ArsR/SmtB family transcription factor [Paenibacillus arenilitoris]MBD2871304.1 winged helix-turn-helix transcriptional regulator [Paenibacillus arenilitoris]